MNILQLIIDIFAVLGVACCLFVLWALGCIARTTRAEAREARLWARRDIVSALDRRIQSLSEEAA